MDGVLRHQVKATPTSPAIHLRHLRHLRILFKTHAATKIHPQMAQIRIFGEV
jgi:hypothetical protein